MVEKNGLDICFFIKKNTKNISWIQKSFHPALSVCRTDPVSGYCYGCGRTDEDKANVEKS